VQRRFYVETLGCPKNEVDSDKIVGTLLADGYAEGANGRESRKRMVPHRQR